MTDEPENAVRRRLLALATVAGGAVIAGATVGAGVAEVTAGEGARALGDRRIPFGGEHQAGILAPYAAHGWFAAFDLEPGVTAVRLAGTLWAWTAVARRLTEGRPVPGDDTVTAGYGPASLTVTAGFGASLPRRLGAGAQPPWQASPHLNEGATILRKGFSYFDGYRPDGAPDARLLFLAFQADPREGFTRVQQRLSGADDLSRFLRHESSALSPSLPAAGPAVTSART
jgi:deferrochelatase/peroxidase EfeB